MYARRGDPTVVPGESLIRCPWCGAPPKGHEIVGRLASYCLECPHHRVERHSQAAAGRRWNSIVARERRRILKGFERAQVRAETWERSSDSSEKR